MRPWELRRLMWQIHEDFEKSDKTAFNNHLFEMFDALIDYVERFEEGGGEMTRDEEQE